MRYEVRYRGVSRVRSTVQRGQYGTDYGTEDSVRYGVRCAWISTTVQKGQYGTKHGTEGPARRYRGDNTARSTVQSGQYDCREGPVRYGVGYDDRMPKIY